MLKVSCERIGAERLETQLVHTLGEGLLDALGGKDLEESGLSHLTKPRRKAHRPSWTIIWLKGIWVATGECCLTWRRWGHNVTSAKIRPVQSCIRRKRRDKRIERRV